MLPPVSPSAPFPTASIPAPAARIQQTALLQQPGSSRPGFDTRASEEQSIEEITIQLEPPGPERIFQLKTWDEFQETLRQEGRNRNPPRDTTFPEEPILTRERYYGRNWPRMEMIVEPNFVGYSRLLFEQKNAERYGWDLGPVHPFLAVLTFYKDILLLPYHSMTDPFRFYEYNTGYGLPGDPTPFLLYPPEISFTGSIAETASILAVLAVFP